MTRIVVVGAGGHAKVVIDILLDNGVDVIGCVADVASPEYRGVPVYIGDEALASFRSQGVDNAVIAIGSNYVRARLGDLAKRLEFALPSVVSRSAQISPTVLIGAGTVVMPNAVINADARIGDLAIVNSGATVDHDCVIGDFAHIAPGVHLSGGVSVGARALVGVGTAARPLAVIGADSTIGAGSVVIGRIEAGVIAFGVPAVPQAHNEE